MKIELFCACGAGWYGEVDEKGATVIQRVWAEVHGDPGCAPCDRATAVAARRKAEAEEEKTINRKG